MSAFDVIFVDDEISLTEIFQHYVLSRYKNWRFTTFNNASMVYKEIVTGHLSSTVWIIDLMMPGKNGVQVAEAVRAFHGQGPVIIAYTALDRGDINRQEEYRYGMHHFNQLVNKMEDPVGLLSLADVWVAQDKQASTGQPNAYAAD
jgi:CheY-like chemotaxis protein